MVEELRSESLHMLTTSSRDAHFHLLKLWSHVSQWLTLNLEDCNLFLCQFGNCTERRCNIIVCKLAGSYYFFLTFTSFQTEITEHCFLIQILKHYWSYLIFGIHFFSSSMKWTQLTLFNRGVKHSSLDDATLRNRWEMLVKASHILQLKNIINIVSIKLYVLPSLVYLINEILNWQQKQCVHYIFFYIPLSRSTDSIDCNDCKRNFHEKEWMIF